MKAVQIDGPGRVAIIDVPEPTPGDGEVLVAVRAAAVCATDRRMAALATHSPRIPGHEIAGILEDGTPVGVHPNLGCGRCASCALGLENRCPDHVEIGIQRDGGLAEVGPPSRAPTPWPSRDSPSRRAPLVEPLATVLHAARVLEVRKGYPAVVVGAGSRGICAMWALQAMGAARVVVMQRSRVRRGIAAEMGADGVLGQEGDPGEVLGARPRVALVAASGAEALT
jgi:threonine dehydrogenase-like Zn-dependent dehydrogenase